jgi:hypothetical protein
MPHSSNHKGGKSAVFPTFKYKCRECDYQFQTHCSKNYEMKIRLHWRKSHNATNVEIGTNFHAQAHLDDHNQIPVNVNTCAITASIAQRLNGK